MMSTSSSSSSSTTTTPSETTGGGGGGGICCCDGCGLPERRLNTSFDDDNNNTKIIPLKRCSRCKSVWYHDAICQRNHYKIHKKDCIRIQRQKQQQQQRKGEAEGDAASTTTTTTTTTGKEGKEDFEKNNANNVISNNIENEKENNNTKEKRVNNKNQKLLPPQVRVENTNSIKGNILVANVTIPKGKRIINHQQQQNNNKNDDYDYWDPLVPPVLHTDYRLSRCGYCFGLLTSSNNQNFYRFDDIYPPRSQYVLLFCSKSCRDISRNKHFDKEEKAISLWYSSYSYSKPTSLLPPPPKIFSTAILVYRLILAATEDETIKTKLNQLQNKYYDLPTTTNTDSTENNNNNNNEYHHTQAVIATVSTLIEHTKSFFNFKNITTITKDYIKQILVTIKINGFAICDGEYTSIGIGLYSGIPSYINHSCKPNIIQSFIFGLQSQQPKLILTAYYKNILPNDEICISYIDNSSPCHIRRLQLRNNYFFDCICDACNDMELESYLVGLRCLDCCNKNDNNDNKKPAAININIVSETSSSSSSSSSNITANNASTTTAAAPNARRSYKCLNCSNTNFQRQLQLISTFNNFNNNNNESKNNPSEMQFDKIKRMFFSSSWYYQEYGERLAQYYLDQLSSSSSSEEESNNIGGGGGNNRQQQQQEQENAARRARSIYKELLLQQQSLCNTTTDGDDAFPLTSSCMFRRQLILYKIAKLELFLLSSSSSSSSGGDTDIDTDPRTAISCIESVRQFYSTYYPTNHEHMIGISNCLYGGGM